MRTAVKKRLKWFLYLGSEPIAEGEAQTLSQVGRESREAAYVDASQRGWNPEVLGSGALVDYKISIYTQRMRCIEHRQPLVGL